VISLPGYAPFGVTATGSWANGQPLDTAAQMAAPPYANPNEHRAPTKSPSECGWKLGDTEALRGERQLGRHQGSHPVGVDLLTIKAFSWKLPGGSGNGPFTVADSGRPNMPAWAANSRVSWSESLGGQVARQAYFIALNTNECPSLYKGDSAIVSTLVKPPSRRSLMNSSFQYHRMARSSVTHETKRFSL
jgi:hypothetical protein